MVKVKEDMTGWVMAEHGVPDSRWIVLERADDIVSPNGTIQAAYKCECNCERKTIQVVRATSLKHGYSKSCGCIKIERLQSEEHKKNTANKCRNKTGRVRPRTNIIGQKFGMLTVCEQIDDYVHPSGQRFAQYRCLCDCGNYVNVVGNDLTRIETSDHKPKTHCGCQTAKNQSDAQRKQNPYEIHGDVAIGTTYNTRDRFFVDLEDLELVRNYCWFVHEDDTGYRSLMARIPGTDKHIKMSHLLGFKYYDHANRNSLDNRKSNFRKATNSENMMNRSLFSNNKSGVSGVYWDKTKKKWIASVKINKKDKYLGAYAEKDDAIKARLQAEADYYGEFAPQQHLFEQYGI